MAYQLEGLMAVNKPRGISSAQVIRDLQRIFRPHPFFQELLHVEEQKRRAESHNQMKRRRKAPIEVKMGHGGTLDPMASGVLVIGVGRPGTKQLGNFMACQKTYEAVALFGCETDSYDAMGKVVRMAPYSHITREAVEKALGSFRGEQMQKPPLFSALNHQGKRYYEYAREGKPLPVEIKARPVTVLSLEILDFALDHDWEFPTKDVGGEEGQRAIPGEGVEGEAGGDTVDKAQPTSGEGTQQEAEGGPPDEALLSANEGTAEKHDLGEEPPPPAPKKQKLSTPEGDGKPPAVHLRMTVTSGFYVRSFIHDLGEALSSAAHLVKLVRTQQHQFELGKNVIEWEDLKSEDPADWENQVLKALGPEAEQQEETSSAEAEQQQEDPSIEAEERA